LPENSTLIDLIRQRLTSYHAHDALEEELAIKEILQEVALYSLWRGGFFEVAAFQDGTSLRILHKLPRFSEDLDFILKQPDTTFDWSRYLHPLLTGLTEFGLRSEVLDKSSMDRNIREAPIKNDSISNQLNLSFNRGRNHPTLKIKLEIDINPPTGSAFSYTYLDFPLDFEVCHQDLSSNFALKIHALLCSPYIKGRDWYDFNWYIKQKVPPNLQHLRAALNQYGPWKGQNPTVSTRWVIDKLTEKITAIDWPTAAADVERFLGTAEHESLKIWSARFFTARVLQLPSSDDGQLAS
jgi:predicted nucleotidyltransferase component of viral defense system